MPHYAELNENNEVIYVTYMSDDIITDENGNEVEQLGIDHLHLHNGRDRRWIRTSYGGNFRGRYAGIGYSYLEDLDIFVPPKPYPSWAVNASIADWEAPIQKPELSQDQIDNSFRYVWNEDKYNSTGDGWILITNE